MRRLLGSLDAASYDRQVDLVISVDRSDTLEVAHLARAFSWRHGTKEVIEQPRHLGLRRHVLACGDLALRHGSVIVLEDDLFVSPHFYGFATQALDAYGGDERIAGISLYAHAFNETAQLAFRPVPDDSDMFFLQLASSWGQCWTAAQWRGFRAWHDAGSHPPPRPGALPHDIARWRETSWKKDFVRYLLDEHKLFVYPRQSLTTNFCDPGVHTRGPPRLEFQVPLQTAPRVYRFKPLDESTAVYDAHCEIFPDRLRRLAPWIAAYDLTVDLYGQKDLRGVETAHALTAKPSRTAIKRFALELKPHELNVAHDRLGGQLALCRTSAAKNVRVEVYDVRVAYYFDVPRLYLAPPQSRWRRRLAAPWRRARQLMLRR